MTMSAKREAHNLIEAEASGLSAEAVEGNLAKLLGAAELLKEAAPAPEKPDAAFASALREDLLSRFGELTAVAPGEPKAERTSGAKRWAWLAAPALAAAAAVIILLVLGVFSTPAPPSVATLRVTTGRAVVIDKNGHSRSVTASGPVAEDDTVRVAGRSRAALQFKNRNVARLEAGTVAKVDGYSSHAVTMKLDTGKIYNRVIKGTAYSVVARGVTVKATGTAFDVEYAGRVVKAFVFEGTVKVLLSLGGPSYDVGQGAVAIVTFTDGHAEIQIIPFDLGMLDFSWLAYNRDLDHRAGFPLGVLDQLAPTPPQGVTPPALPAPATSATAPSGKTTPTSTPTPTPTPTSTPVTQPTTPSGKPSASLSLGVAGPPVTMSWQGSNVASATSVSVLRSPGGVIATLAPAASGSYTDSAVQGGNTYSYSVAFNEGDRVIATSNVVTVAVPAPAPPPPSLEVSLDGSASATNMSLKWGSSGSPLPDSWVVLRSEGGSPSYPSSTYAELGGGSAGGSFTDYKVDNTRVYYWRVAAVYGGRVIAYSNVVSNK
jgi:ferric-dicitrate binding protein FerR (iron transport regulator)